MATYAPCCDGAKRSGRRRRIRGSGRERTRGDVLFYLLEIVAIQFGKRDPFPVQKPGGRFLRLLRILFGTRQPNPLANERLEALRLVVIAMRQRQRSPEAAVEATLAAGIRRSQLDALAAELRASSA